MKGFNGGLNPESIREAPPPKSNDQSRGSTLLALSENPQFRTEIHRLRLDMMMFGRAKSRGLLAVRPRPELILVVSRSRVRAGRFGNPLTINARPGKSGGSENVLKFGRRETSSLRGPESAFQVK
jgi:hypothetical protein